MLKIFNAPVKVNRILNLTTNFLTAFNKTGRLQLITNFLTAFNKTVVYINSTSKCLFYYLNNFRRFFGFATFAIRHTQISDDKYALQSLQNKNWPHFVKTVLEISNDDVDLSSVTDQNEINIINETFENLNICKECYNPVYNNIAGCFQEYLNKIPTLYQHKFVF